MKYTSPNNLNTEPYGSVWEHVISDSEIHRYIQTSKDTNKPEWKTPADMIEKVFEHNLQDPKFVELLLELYTIISTPNNVIPKVLCHPDGVGQQIVVIGNTQEDIDNLKQELYTYLTYAHSHRG